MQLLGSHMKGLEARTANYSQVHIDKHKLAALNTAQVKVASSKFWQSNDGVSLYHWLQLFFKILM